MAFPCNQFAKQEPGTPEDIKKYAAGYGVEFDMFGKVEVNGQRALPLYKFLKSTLKGSLGNFIKWNYAKVCVCVCTCSYVCVFVREVRFRYVCLLCLRVCLLCLCVYILLKLECMVFLFCSLFVM